MNFNAPMKTPNSQADEIAKKYIGAGAVALSPSTPRQPANADAARQEAANGRAQKQPSLPLSQSVEAPNPNREGPRPSGNVAPQQRNSPDEKNAPVRPAATKEKQGGAGAGGAILDMARLRSLPKLL
jgi:hypothetical protein